MFLQVIFYININWSLSFFRAFYSPTVMRPNDALTYNEIAGMKWFYHSKVDYPSGAIESNK